VSSTLVKWLFLVFDKLFEPQELIPFLRARPGGSALVASLPGPALLSPAAYCMEAAELVLRRGMLDTELLAALQELSPSGQEIDDLMLAVMANEPEHRSGPLDSSHTRAHQEPSSSEQNAAQIVARSSHLQGERLEGWMRLLNSELFAVGTSFYQSIPNVKDILLQKASEGARIRYLFFDPRSPHLDLVAQGFGQSPLDLEAELQKTVRALGELRDALPEELRDNLQARLYSNPPSFRMYAFDTDAHDGGRSIVVPYTYGVDSPLLPAFELSTAQDEYQTRAQELWDKKSVPLSDIRKIGPGFGPAS